MQSLIRCVARTHEETERLAGLGCSLADEFARDRNPQFLNEGQDWLAQKLAWTESRIATLGRRSARAGAALRRRIEKTPGLRTVLGEHMRLLDSRLQALALRASILRQLGDALAWLVLGADIQRILLACDLQKTHRLPTGIGALGPRIIRTQLNLNGDFLALDNDLTRCLGVGDLTVTSLRDPAVSPLLLEVKTKGELKIGSMAEVDLIAAPSPIPCDERFYAEVIQVLGMRDRANPKLNKRGRRQAKQLVERTKVAVRMSQTMLEEMPPLRRRHWHAMESVLRRADMLGAAYDVPEDGLAFVAVRNDETDDALASLASIAVKLHELGVTERPEEITGLNTLNLQQNAKLSPYALPLALLPLSVYLRTRLLTRRLIYGAVFAADLWPRSMAAAGVAFQVADGNWLVGRGRKSLHFPPHEVAKLTVGVAFSGLSPREIVEICRDVSEDP